MGESDKGKTVRMLKTWYQGEYGRIISIGLGDGLNDLPLLREVEHPVLVRKEDGTHDADVSFPGLIRTGGIGPAGWNEAVMKLLKGISAAS
jgi:mannosyl-3-phosphoglycerate phosphatase